MYRESCSRYTFHLGPAVLWRDPIPLRERDFAVSMTGNYIRISPTQLSEFQGKPDSVVDFIFTRTYDTEDDRQIDIDKTWHGIHFLLTGDPWKGEPPLFNAVMGGKQIGTEDPGYGPPRYLTPDQVRDVAQALSEIHASDLRSRFDPERFAREDIYPNIWDEGEEALDYLMDYYVELVRFFSSAAAAGDAVLLCIM